MKKLCCHWIIHDLTEIQKEQRVQQSKELLSILQSLSAKQTTKVITVDESCFSCDMDLMVSGHIVEKRLKMPFIQLKMKKLCFLHLFQIKVLFM